MSSHLRFFAPLGLAALVGTAIVSDASAFGGGGFAGFGRSSVVARPGGVGHPGFVRLPPVGHGPRPIPIRLPHPPHPRPWPPLPWPHHPGHLPPIVIGHHHHHWPIVPVGLITPVAAPAPLAIAATPVASCGPRGSFVSIVFVPTVTAADITDFLKTYDVTMADGPDKDGVYRIRLSSDVLPAERIAEILAAMRTQTLIVASVAGA